jgi:hypothetical protein
MSRPNITELKPALGFEVAMEPIILKSNGSEIERYHAIVRSDTQKPISIFKKSWKPLLNSEFTDMAEQVAKITKFPLMGFQSIGDGSRVLAYLKNENKVQILGHDTEDYLVLGNSHNGTTSVFLGSSNIMLRCMNQWSHVIQNLRIRHTKTLHDKVFSLMQDLDVYFAGKDKILETYRKMEKIKISPAIIEALTDRLFKMDTQEEITPRKQRMLDDFNESLETEMTDLGRNMFGLFQSVTHYSTHKIDQKKNVAFGNIYGQAAEKNAIAYNFGLELIKNGGSLK